MLERKSKIPGLFSCVSILAVLACTASVRARAPGDWLARAQGTGANAAESEVHLPTPAKMPPLPPHSIEGVGGCLITPSGYVVNPGPEGTDIGRPAVSASFLNLGHKKDVTAVAITQTFLRRFELGYSVSRFDLGTVPNDLNKAAGIHIGRSDVFLHNFNLRAMLIEENSYDLPLPATQIRRITHRA